MNTFRTTLLAAALSVMTIHAFSQTKPTLSRSGEGNSTVSASPQISFDQYPLDAPLDPHSYRLGGGDRLALQVESVPPLFQLLTVGIDGSLIIPNVGSVAVAGLTLHEATDKIVHRISERLMKAPVAVSLAAPRQVRVRVRGTAVVPNIYERAASDRVSTLVTSSDVLRRLYPSDERSGKTNLETVTLARRSILLIRSDGKRQYVDLDMYRSTGDSRWNPHIAEGDEIIANTLESSTPSTAIGGAVWMAAEYEYVVGDRVADLLRFARGARPDAVMDSVSFARVGEPVRVISLLGPDTSLSLLPGDRLWIPSDAPSGRGRVVTIAGEVRGPGTYPLLEGKTRLSDLIVMAGGMTEHARIHGATMHRGRLAPDLQRESQMLAQRGNAAIDDTTYVRQEEDLRLLGERVSVDFRNALAKPGTDDDPFVQPGDRIHVPRVTGTVYVFGQVVSPGHVRFVEGDDVASYVHRAGGFTDQAKSGDVVVIKSASRQWIDPDDTVIEEGDAVWVPKSIDQPLAYELSSYSMIAGIISALATVVFIFTR